MPHMLCFDYHCTPILIARVTNLLFSSRARLATSSEDTHGCSSVIRMTVSDVQRVNDGQHQQREAHAPCLHTHTKATPAATTTTLHPLPHPTPPASRLPPIVLLLLWQGPRRCCHPLRDCRPSSSSYPPIATVSILPPPIQGYPEHALLESATTKERAFVLIILPIDEQVEEEEMLASPTKQVRDNTNLRVVRLPIASKRRDDYHPPPFPCP